MQVKRRKISAQNPGFSMIELIMVIAIFAIIVAISLPAISQARESARRAQCLNHMRNLVFGLTQYDHFQNRLPAAGYYYDPSNGLSASHHSWAVSILPHIDERGLSELWDFDKPVTDPANAALTNTHIKVYVCPDDVSQVGLGDLSYVVNGGFGFTIRARNGVGDCPVDWQGQRLDLNGDGLACTGDVAIDNLDRQRFQQTSLFFLENWKEGGTERYHSLADIHDGSSHTFLLTENVRAGCDPADEFANFASPDPYRSAFYVGNPCTHGNCAQGNVDYHRSNNGRSKINSGLWRAEGKSPVPNSFHPGGVNMAYADGHLKFLSEEIDGAVYAALASPQGNLLNKTPLQQAIVSAPVD